MENNKYPSSNKTTAASREQSPIIYTSISAAEEGNNIEDESDSINLNALEIDSHFLCVPTIYEPLNSSNESVDLIDIFVNNFKPSSPHERHKRSNSYHNVRAHGGDGSESPGMRKYSLNVGYRKGHGHVEYCGEHRLNDKAHHESSSTLRLNKFLSASISNISRSPSAQALRSFFMQNINSKNWVRKSDDTSLTLI